MSDFEDICESLKKNSDTKIVVIWTQTTQNNKIECQKNDKKRQKKVIFGQWTNTKMAASAVIWQFCAVVLQVEGDESPPPWLGRRADAVTITCQRTKRH